MDKLIEAAQNAKEIMASQNSYCPKCNERQISPFDKLFVYAYGICYMCSPSKPGPDEDELMRKSDNIFAIIEAN